MRPPPAPEVVRRALERLRGGEAYAIVAGEAGVTESTLRRWRRRAGDAEAGRPVPPIMRADIPAPPDAPSDLAAELERVAVALDAAGGADLARIVRRGIDALRAGRSPSPDEDDGPPLPDAGTDVRAFAVAMIVRTQRALERQERAHNSRAATQLSSALERWTRLLKQIDASGDGADVITIPRNELATRIADLRAKLAAYAANGPLCSECSRRIRADWGAATSQPDPSRTPTT